MQSRHKRAKSKNNETKDLSKPRDKVEQGIITLGGSRMDGRTEDPPVRLLARKTIQEQRPEGFFHRYGQDARRHRPFSPPSADATTPSIGRTRGFGPLTTQAEQSHTKTKTHVRTHAHVGAHTRVGNRTENTLVPKYLGVASRKGRGGNRHRKRREFKRVQLLIKTH